MFDPLRSRTRPRDRQAALARSLKRSAAKQKKGTTLTFTAEELVALEQYVSAGLILLRTTHPVLAKVKGAMTRLGLAVPKGFRGEYGPRRTHRDED